MLLMAFDIMACPNFDQKYSTKNNFYFPITLQCAMKIEYMFNDLFRTEYKGLKLNQSSIQSNEPPNEKVNVKDVKADNDEESFDALFTIPEKKITTNKKQLISNDILLTKIIILNNHNPKDKNIYNISKINGTKDLSNTLR
jgi:hypothetical protein